MSWLMVIAAGLIEVCWTITLKYSHGFTRPLPTALAVVLIAASMFLLATATKTLSVGTAYAVWVGIGAFGAAIAGILLFGEPATPARLVFLTMLIVAIIGLKLVSPV